MAQPLMVSRGVERETEARPESVRPAALVLLPPKVAGEAAKLAAEQAAVLSLFILM